MLCTGRPGAAVTGAQFVAIGLISAAILAFEVLLMRLYAIVGWHHFAYMMISIALLGFGASGTALALLGGRLAGRFPAAFAVCAALFGVTAIAGFALALRLPFQPSGDRVGPTQLFWLGLAYALSCRRSSSVRRDRACLRAAHRRSAAFTLSTSSGPGLGHPASSVFFFCCRRAQRCVSSPHSAFSPRALCFCPPAAAAIRDRRPRPGGAASRSRCGCRRAPSRCVPMFPNTRAYRWHCMLRTRALSTSDRARSA